MIRNIGNKENRFLIFVKVDERCNIQCSFCYQKNKRVISMDNNDSINMAIKNISIGIDKVLKIRETDFLNRNSFVTVCFFGGEPTMNTGAMNTIMKRINEKYPNNDFIKFSFTTNGYKFDDSVVEVLHNIIKYSYDHKIGIMVSSDFSMERFNENRKSLAGEKIYDTVKKNIAKYVDFATKNGGHIQVSSVIASSIDSEFLINGKIEIVDKNNKKNIKIHSKQLYDYDMYNDEYKNALIKYYDNSWSKIMKINNKDELIWNSIDSIFGTKREYSECNSLYSINADGSLSFCTKRLELKEHLTEEELIESIFNKNYNELKFDCQKEKVLRGEETKGKVKMKYWDMINEKYTTSVLPTQIDTSNMDPSYIEKICEYIYIIYHFYNDKKKIRYNGLCLPDEFSHMIDVDIVNPLDLCLTVRDDNVFVFNLIDDKDFVVSKMSERYWNWFDSTSVKKSFDFMEKIIDEIEKI